MMQMKRLAPSPTHAESSRTLLDLARVATLATVALDPPGYPFGSLVNFATTAEGDVILLISDLAEHTHNLRGDARASLMVSQVGSQDPLAEGRVTLIGDVSALPEATAERALYLEKNPSAAQYVDFADFHFFRLHIKTVRYVGGFGRMSWLDLNDYREARPDPVSPHAEGIISHMNDDHVENMIEMVRYQAAIEATKAVMTAVDRYGFDIDIDTAEGPGRVRLAFTQPLESYSKVRSDMVELVRRARAATT